jgi:hypothetical protein
VPVSRNTTAPAGEVLELAVWVKSAVADTDEAEHGATSDTVVVVTLVAGTVVRVAEGDGDEQAPSRTDEPPTRTAATAVEPDRRAVEVRRHVPGARPRLMPG